MPATCISYDVETHRIQPGLLAPRLVCASAACLVANGQLIGDVVDRERAVELYCRLLDDPTKVIAGANIAYDLLVMAVTLAEMGVDAMPELYRLLMDEQRVFDVQIAEALDAVAEGCLGNDPRTGGPLVNPETGRRGRYSLAICTDLVLGRTDAKANDEYRERYGELDGIPIDQWPEVARTYPIDDARNTAEVALAQAGHLPRAGAHRWGSRTVCDWCGIHPKQAYAEGGGAKYAPCRAPRRSRNLHDLANQVGTAYAMHGAAAWGFRVNQDNVTKIEDNALDGRVEAEEPFVKAGLLKRNRDGSTSRDMSAICRAVAFAYGANASHQCVTCKGTRKVVSAKAKLVKCPVCSTINAEFRANCARCAGTGTIPDPKQLVNCTDCASTGLDLSVAPNIPRTDTGRVGTGRDVLNESGDETLMGLADHQEDAKTLDVYVPYLRRARVPLHGHGPSCPRSVDEANDCACTGPWRDIPLTLWPNVLLETGRTSYGGVIQLFPRAAGRKVKNSKGEEIYVPSLRECIEARPRHFFSSTDYESGELVTHGQSCIWITGESALAKALVGGLKIHNALGASMIGMAYDEFMKRAKEPQCKDARQAAKPGNFGFPGGMGPVKMVLQQRKQGPDTPHPSGPTWVKDDNGKPVRGYKGLRFCILMDGADRCGGEGNMLREYRDQPISPTCKRCIACAIRLKDAWLKQWPENEEYFRYINDCVEHGQLITETHLTLWPHLKPFFQPNKRLAPAEIMQHVSGRIRGGVDYCSAANGFFQGLLADLAKSALRRVSRECYDNTVVVPEFAHANSVRSAYTGGSSPLFGSRVIVFQHDEMICEHPEDVAHDAAMRVSEIMVEEMRWYCPDLAPACAAEPALMRKWFKGASPWWNLGFLDEKTGKRDQSKRAKDVQDWLIPWEPKAA